MQEIEVRPISGQDCVPKFASGRENQSILQDPTPILFAHGLQSCHRTRQDAGGPPNFSIWRQHPMR